MKQRDIVTNILAGAAAGLVGTIVLQAIMKTRQRYLPQTAPPMNEHPGEFMVKQAEYFARRLEAANPERGRQVELAYRLAFGRRPSAEERDAVVSYARRHGLANACRVLLNANEFLFVD